MNRIVRQKTKITDTIEEIEQTKWRWASHIDRLNDNRRNKNSQNGDLEKTKDTGKLPTIQMGDCEK